MAALAETLSRTLLPLLTLDLGRTEPRHDLRGTVDSGRAMLSGRQDRILTCGIDKWLGGVHLKSGSRIWRGDDTRQHVGQSRWS